MNNGIIIEECPHVDINSNWFIGNWRGLYVSGSSVDVHSTTFRDNTMEGVYLSDSAMKMSLCSLQGNKRGITASSASTAAVDNTMLVWNSDNAVYAEGASGIDISGGCRLTDNNIGLVSFDNSTVRITDSTMNNTLNLEFYSWKNSNIFTYDTTFVGSSFVQDTSKLTVNWSLIVKVSGPDSLPVSGAQPAVPAR